MLKGVENISSYDITGENYKINRSVDLTHTFCERYFNPTYTERNVEKILRKFQNREISPRDLYRIFIGNNNDNFYISFMKALTRATKEEVCTLTGFADLTSGKEVILRGNKITAYTTAANFDNIEQLVKLFFNFVTLPESVLSFPCEVGIIQDSIHVENFNETHESNYKNDDFERYQSHYVFDMVFDLKIRLSQPLKASLANAAYASIKQGGSLFPIISSIIQNPGNYLFDANSSAIFYKPQSYEDAREIFLHRFSTKCVSAADLINVLDPALGSKFKNGTYNYIPSTSKTKLPPRSPILRIVMRECSPRYLDLSLLSLQSKLRNLIQVIDDNAPNLQLINTIKQYRAVHSNNASNYVSVNYDSFKAALETDREQIKMVIWKFMNLFGEIRKLCRAKNDKISKLLAEAKELEIQQDPILFTEDSDPAVAEYAHQLILGFES